MDIEELVSGYVDYLVDSFDEVWTKVKIPADKLEALSAIGGLDKLLSPSSWLKLPQHGTDILHHYSYAL